MPSSASGTSDVVPPASARFPRRKPRRLSVAGPARLYSLARRFVPGRGLLRFLLEAERQVRAFAWEQAWRSLDAETALSTCRPYILPLLERAVPRGSTVVDLGGGAGVIGRFVAERASQVLIIDSNPQTAAAARAACSQWGAVDVACGDMLEVLAQRGSFDVALLLHTLGYFEDPVAALSAIRAKARRLVLELPDFGSDPLNGLRLREGLPAWTDAEYVAEYEAESLAQLLEAAGWLVGELTVRSGHLYVVADARSISRPQTSSSPGGASSPA